jgi:hypothetical protein
MEFHAFYLYKFSCNVSYVGDAWKVLLDTAGAIIPDSEQEALISLTKFVDQLPSVFGQVLLYLLEASM